MSVEQQPPKKKPIALAITIVLLVCSLNGNMFLYSQYLSNIQEKKYETGQRVASDAIGAVAFYNAILPELEKLGKSTELLGRNEAKFSAGAAFRNVDHVLGFLKEAHQYNGTEFAADKLEAYFNAVQQSLAKIGGHEGALTAAEQDYLAKLQEAFHLQLEAVTAFNADALESRSLSIQIGNGYNNWLEIADKLEQAIDDHTDVKLQ
ncbi:hypothetical protein BBD42_20510 [Paenibacillus sp. BIHB 4019]|uniref:Uncharacterized protein n=1 Tax=Paenibacillus sp. BIHB 4019 TaxID=1870819 RepID=A0A1B2DLJ2_9BACL|nr:hypothetical protein [Paenibacillus sp. BIHB 4019]ANY68590.1 hypothetical protein BBD42_20510 [Paenibacillus sp. BIHB 4019]